MNYLVIVFRSRNDALALRSYLSGRGVSSTAINAPRSISQSCGIALKITNITPTTLTNLIKSCPTEVRCTVYSARAEQGGIGYSLVR